MTATQSQQRMLPHDVHQASRPFMPLVVVEVSAVW
jgi:hypothetical protein